MFFFYFKKIDENYSYLFYKIILYFTLFLKIVSKKRINITINFSKDFYASKNRKLFLNHATKHTLIFLHLKGNSLQKLTKI